MVSRANTWNSYCFTTIIFGCLKNRSIALTKFFYVYIVLYIILGSENMKNIFCRQIKSWCCNTFTFNKTISAF